MPTRHILKKQLCWTHSRFILGCIGPTSELSPQTNQSLLCAIENEMGPIEETLPAQDFPNPPRSYFTEAGEQPLSTVICILERWGSCTDLHFTKLSTLKVEEQLLNSMGYRAFNINPGTVSAYGLWLASHKPTGNRPEIGPWFSGGAPILFHFGMPETYRERVMKWEDGRLVLTEEAARENRFPEYHEASRVAKFEGLVRTLPKSDVSVELMADKYR